MFYSLTIATKKFDNFVLLGDLNMTAENTKMEQLIHSLRNSNYSTDLF